MQGSELGDGSVSKMFDMQAGAPVLDPHRSHVAIPSNRDAGDPGVWGLLTSHPSLIGEPHTEARP